MGDAVFSVQAIMSLRDLISGKLSAIAGKLAATGRAAAGLGVKMASLAKAMLPVVAVAGLVLGSLVGAAMSTRETSKALGELASVGVKDMAAMEAAATKFSNRFAGTTKAQFIAAAYDIKSGIASLSDAGVAKYTDLSALTAKATKSTVGTMTSLFATGYGIYKKYYNNLSDLQFGEMFSAGIAASVKQFKTTGSQMAAAISQAGPSIAGAMRPMEEGYAVMGMLQATMSGSESGVKYRQFLDHAAAAGQKLGLKFLDANKQLRSMPEILGELHKKFGPVLDATEKIQIKKAFASEEAVATIGLLYDKVGDLTANINAVGGAMGKGRAFTLAMAQTMNKDLGAAVQRMGQRLHNLVEIIGGMFVPILQPVIDGVSAFVLVLQDAASWLAGTGWGSAILGLVAGLSVLVTASAAVAAGMWAMTVVGPIATAALAPLGAVLGALSAPIWIVIGLVAALVVAWRTNFGGMRDTLKGWWDTISLVFRGVAAVLGSLSGTTGQIKGQLAKDIEAKGLLGVVTKISKVIYRVRQFFASFWAGLKASVAGIGAIFAPLASAFDPILDALAPLWAELTQLFGIAADSKLSGWATAGKIAGQTLGWAFRLIALSVRMALVPLQLIGAVLGWVIGVFTGKGSDFGGNLRKVFAGIWQSIEATFPGVSAALEKLWMLFRVWLVGLGSRCIAWIADAFSGAGAAITGALSGVWAALTGWWAGIKAWFAGLNPVGWISNAFAGVGAAIMAGFEQVKSFLGGINLASAGAAIMHTLAAGVRSAAGSVWSSVKGALGKVANLIPHSDAKEGPLATLTAGGRAIMSTMATGVASAGPHLARATSAAMAGAALTLSGLGAPVLPDLTATASWQAVPPPAVQLADATTDQAPAGSRPGAPDGSKSGHIVIQSLTVTLPGVTDGQGFAQSLQRFVEQYDA